MDKDRTDGSINQAKGSLKEGLGKLTGDSKLEAEGKSDKLGGKIQNTIGGIKDTLKGK
ncbi:MAG TPA: CsbD family protein [Microvirga sp.]|nr:CsbD family protein [Microvirga sp.]